MGVEIEKELQMISRKNFGTSLVSLTGAEKGDHGGNKIAILCNGRLWSVRTKEVVLQHQIACFNARGKAPKDLSSAT